MRDIVEGTTETNALRGIGQLSQSNGYRADWAFWRWDVCGGPRDARPTRPKPLRVCVIPTAALRLSQGGQIEKVESVGIASFTFTASQMSALRPKTYEVGILVTSPQSVEQAFLGRISVLKGL